MARVLVVDDDETVASVVATYLQRAGHDAQILGDGRLALDAIRAAPPDLVVLDLMLPGLDGLEVCRRVRESWSHLPIIMLTALAQPDDRIAGLEVGADDYVTKPFSPRELVLRVESVLRRVAAAPATAPKSQLVAGGICVDPVARRATRNGEQLALTVRELDLLTFLLMHPGEAFNREQLMREVWGWTFGDQSTVTVHVRRLREKVEDDPTNPTLIQTVWGIGYRLELPLMTLSWKDLGAALLWAAIAGLATWFVLYPVRRHSLAGLLATLVLTGAGASAGALWGAIHSMTVPWWDWKTMIALTVFSGAVTAVAAVAVGRRLAKDNESLRSAVAELGAGRVPSASGRRLTAEVEQVRRELSTTAAALAATRERERALETARSELVSWVSHDLRTPLAGLRAMAEALEDGVVDNPELYYKQIGGSVERLNQMVEDLFDLSRIQAGYVSHNTESIALDDLVSDCVAALEPLATAQGVRLTGSVAEPAAVTGNGPELNRALTNLVANAIRHTRARGSVDVRVGLTGAAPDAGGSAAGAPLAEVVVRDECGGIPDEHLARVFDVGFRGEAARTPHGLGAAAHGGERAAGQGAGLGLAITRGIVEAHDGTVAVQNTPGGCEFRVRLPVLPS